MIIKIAVNEQGHAGMLKEHVRFIPPPTFCNFAEIYLAQHHVKAKAPNLNANV